MLGVARYTKIATEVIGVIVRGEWTGDKFFCRTIEEEPRVVIRSFSELRTTKAAAKKLELNK